MSKEARDAYYAQAAHPFEKYSDLDDDDDLLLPLTKAGFENLLSETCRRFELPADDGSRSTLAGYIHHIPPDKHSSTMTELGVILHKAISNSMTWQVDQEVKARRQVEGSAVPKEEPTLSVVGSSDVPPAQGA